MKAIGKYLVVEIQVEEQKTQSGLLITGEDHAQIRYQKGKVISAGTDVKHIGENDLIYFDKRNTHQARLEGEAYQIVPENCVVIVL